MTFLRNPIVTNPNVVYRAHTWVADADDINEEAGEQQLIDISKADFDCIVEQGNKFTHEEHNGIEIYVVDA